MPKPVPVVAITDDSIIQGLEKDYTCPSCAKILCHTVITSCGTKICQYCFVISLRDKRCCPVCEKRGCRDFIACPQIDARIAANYNKVSRALRDDRQVLVNRRKLLQQKFELEDQIGAHATASSLEDDDEVFPNQEEIKWKLMEEKLQSETKLERGSPQWVAARKTKQTQIMKDIEKTMEREASSCSGGVAEKKASRTHTRTRSKLQPLKPIHCIDSTATPSKNSLVKKASTIFLGDKSKMATNAKPKGSNSKLVLALKPHSSISSTSTMLKRTPSKYKNLASVNQANDRLGQELTNTYERFLSAAEKSASVEQKIWQGSGDNQVKSATSAMSISTNRLRNRVEPAYEGQSPIYHGLDREYSSRHDLDTVAAPVPATVQKKVRSRMSEVSSTRIPQANELLAQIDRVKTYLKRTALEELKADMSVETFKTGSNPGSRLAHHMLKNILEIQTFLQKRVKEKADKSKDAETQTEARWCEFFGSAAAILKQKCSTTSIRSSASGTATAGSIKTRTRQRK